MTRLSLFSMLFGIIAGCFFIPDSFLPHMNQAMSIILNGIIFFIGIDIGLNKHMFKNLRKYGKLIIYIPVGIIVGSLGGGCLAGLIFHIPMNISFAIASGFGWASLSGIILTNLHNVEIGTIAFLTNIFRWTISMISIPYIAEYLNFYTTIAPAGATSMDSALPMISKNTCTEVVVVSLLNGMILTFLVPILVPFFYSF
ncbi:MAG: lysine exporter LysO family protein [Marinisporobacter sp.]|jgi:uncharacterized membrane protein YbjE (DUF340 family)|nr:lysine exporter LysO family protein [Marinisporobacter sp.]